MSGAPNRVALLVHHERPEAAEVAAGIVEALQALGHEVVLPREDAAVVGLGGLGVAEADLVGDGLGVAVAIGGDGTMLRTVALVADAGVPVLGVNVGQLGYLTEVDPTDALAAIEDVLAGAVEIEERMRIAVAVESARPLDADLCDLPLALNEAVLEKTPMGHTVRIAVLFDGDFFTTYATDGLIVASPTGSTAYSFSARGPILDPDLRALVLTPVSPHMLFDRSMVLSPDLEVRLEVLGHRPATLSLDGRNVGLLHEGDALVCTAAAAAARIVTVRPRDFHRILKAKFGLADR
jgi:NAD+ kinase